MGWKRSARSRVASRWIYTILDIGMPIVDGYEAAARIRAFAPALPILFFSARPIGRPALPELAAASIEKSDDLAELKQAVARLLSTPKQSAPLCSAPCLASPSPSSL